MLFITFGAWGFGRRRASAVASDAHVTSEREPASGYAEHPVDNSGGRELAVLTSDEVAKALRAQAKQLGITEQRKLGENSACQDENDTECLMGLSRPDRPLPH